MAAQTLESDLEASKRDLDYWKGEAERFQKQVEGRNQDIEEIEASISSQIEAAARLGNSRIEELEEELRLARQSAGNAEMITTLEVRTLGMRAVM